MQSANLVKLGGLALVVSGAFYAADTLVDWLSPGNQFGVGIGVSLFGLLGLPALYLVALRPHGLPGLFAHILTSAALTGLAGIALFNNLLRPQLEPEVIGALLGGPALIYFLGTGVSLLAGGILLAYVAWKSDLLPNFTAPLYLLGCIPVALPPLFPAVATEFGGLAISASLIAWGFSLLSASEPEAEIVA